MLQLKERLIFKHLLVYITLANRNLSVQFYADDLFLSNVMYSFYYPDHIYAGKRG